MIYRIYAEKKPQHAVEASALLAELKSVQGIRDLTGVRIFNRYDVEGLSMEEFQTAVRSVFSEPQLDDTYERAAQPPGRPARVGGGVFARPV